VKPFKNEFELSTTLSEVKNISDDEKKNLFISKTVFPSYDSRFLCHE
jgi:hypothetical protein